MLGGDLVTYGEGSSYDNMLSLCSQLSEIAPVCGVMGNHEDELYFLNGDQALVEKFKAMVEAEGTLASVDEWGKRRLAYPINDMAEGYYVLMNFESKPEFPAELERVMKITEGVMRCLTTAVEA